MSAAGQGRAPTLPRAADLLALAGVLSLGAALAMVSQRVPAGLPDWLPYDFSWSEFLAIALAALCYARGLWRLLPAERPSAWRTAAYAAGLALIYAVLQTRFDYMAQHMFFLSRLQHLVLHHLAPFLIALSWPGAVLARGLPDPIRPALRHPMLRRAVRLLQQPAIAAILFVGIIDLWLIPPINFRAMIDPTLYAAMSWSMALDGLFFWLVMLDPRASPPAHSSFGIRLLTVILVMFPQIALGSYLTFSTTDLYPFYDLCGRLYPDITALTDQHYGGLLVWIPASMMSAAAFLLTLNHLRLREDAIPPESLTPQERRMADLSRSWTGR